MSKLEELLTEKRNTKLEHTKDRYIRTGIINAHLDNHPHDYSIYRVFSTQRKLVDEICKDHLWEPSYDGFVSRSNYKFDLSSFEITFDTHKITKQGDKYIPDKSPEALERWSSHIKEFNTLSAADDLIETYYSRYQKRVDEGLDIAMKFFNTFQPDRLETRIAVERRLNESFISFYGEVGINLLVRWLNKLNEPYEVESILEQFKKEVNDAIEYMESMRNSNYLRSIKYNHDFTTELLRAIERYSPRGRYLRDAYKKSLEPITDSFPNKRKQTI